MRQSILFLALALFLTAGCGSSGKLGKKVNEPFQGSGFSSTKKFWRGVGKGESSESNIAKGKADLNAKAELAGQVNTTMKQVTDQYLSENENGESFDVADKFQSLIRQVMNTEIADLRKMDEKQFYNEETDRHTTFIAYEIRKKAMLRFLKKQAEVYDKVNASERALMLKVIELEIAKAEAEED